MRAGAPTASGSVRELFLMPESFDLLGDPIPTGRGRPGRPRHAVTKRNMRKFNMLRAAGWTFDQIAEAIGVSRPTLRRHYRHFVSEKMKQHPGGGPKPGSGRP